MDLVAAVGPLVCVAVRVDRGRRVRCHFDVEFLLRCLVLDPVGDERGSIDGEFALGEME